MYYLFINKTVRHRIGSVSPRSEETRIFVFTFYIRLTLLEVNSINIWQTICLCEMNFIQNYARRKSCTTGYFFLHDSVTNQ